MLDTRKAYSYMNANFILKRTSQSWYAFDNPFDPDGTGKMKMAIKFSWGRVKCWRTGWTGSFMDFVMEYEGLSYFDAKSKVLGYKPSSIDLASIEGVVVRREVSDVNMPLGYTPLMDGTGSLGTRAKKYLEGRGFDLEVLDRMGIGYCNKQHKEEEKNYFGYIVIPFKRKGKLQYYIGRDFIGNFLRYKNPPKDEFGVGKAEIIFNEDALGFYRRNFVLEGWTDAVMMGKDAVATLGWAISNVQKSKLLKSECDEIVFIPDVGKYQQSVKTAMDFIDHKKSVVVVNMDLLEEYGGDVCEIGRDKVYELYRNTKPLTLASAIEILVK